MKVPLADLQFVAFDLETTGLSDAKDSIVEFGAVRFLMDGTVLECFEQLVNPLRPIPEDATRINKITDAMVHGMPTVAEILPRFLTFLNRENTVLMAHNAQFDLGFLRHAMKGHQGLTIARPVLDTLKMDRREIRGLTSYRLEHLAAVLKLRGSEGHRALADARLVMELFRKVHCNSGDVTVQCSLVS